MTAEPTDGRHERGLQTRTALLSAAARVFAERGFAGASVRDVAAAAGVHPALVRYHFESKAGLFECVVDEAMHGLREAIGHAVGQASGPRDAVRKALAAYADHLARDASFPRLIQRGLLDRDPVVLSVTQRHLAPLVAVLGTLSGALPHSPLGDPAEVAVTLFGAAIVPVLYAPVLEPLFGADPLSAQARARRRTHLEALIDLALPETA